MSHHGSSASEPEHLSSGDPAAPRERSGRRLAFLLGGIIALVGLVGGALAAWSAYAGPGAQPSEALPADTLGYASIDLDPSGKQKIEAIRILRTLPAFTDEYDIDTRDDLRRLIVEQGLEGSDCDLDYGADIEPWLGMRFAVAAVPGGDEPDPVLVLQVSDADAAAEGLARLRECDGVDADTAAWEIRGEWAVVAETDEIAQSTADRAAEGSLAGDEDYQTWTGSAGDPGIVTAYAAPAAGRALSELLLDQGVLPRGADQQVEDFGGAALTVRFAGGALEVEAAGRATEQTGYLADTGADVVSALPADTGVAMGLGLEEGWGEALLDRIVAQAGGDAEDALRFAESSLGLELPEDLETLLGESAALSLGGDVDVAALEPGGSRVPVAAAIRGESEEIENILEKLRTAVAAQEPEAGEILQADREDGLVAVGPDADYRQRLLDGGDLGGTDAFEDVVREADRAGLVLFVNFDAGDWVDNVGDADPGWARNLEPLEAAGLSVWSDQDEAHLHVRLTTE